MKRLVLTFYVVFMAALNAIAQNGTKYFSIKGGVTTLESISGSMSFDWNTKYFNQNEIFGEYAQRLDSTHRKTIMAGLVLKPVLFRRSNSTFRIRYGAGIGSNADNIIFAPQAGLEFSQSLVGTDLVISNRNQYILGMPRRERWRAAIELGLRFHLN